MLALYSLTLFFSAGLLFVVQPMVAKIILPNLGGTPAVWTVCMLFFQATLLLGYAYTHVATATLGVRRQSAMHALFLLVPLAILPISASVKSAPGVDSAPILYLLFLLLSLIGLPFFLLSATAPMLQRWLASTPHPAAKDPYFLYWASNGGSMIGLLAYPFWIEPYFTLTQQALYWSYGYFMFATLTLACFYALWRSRPDLNRHPEGEKPLTANPIQTERITFHRRLRWVALSFAPSSLLLGTTTYISTDIAPAPLLWIIPLALYLLSFILVSVRKAIVPHEFLIRRLPFLLLASAITVFSGSTDPSWLLIPLHLLTFFAAAMVCHAELFKDRPSPHALTQFYMWISVGGVLGGLFNALIAPRAFVTVLEYPLAMIVVALLRPQPNVKSTFRPVGWLDVSLPLALAALIGGLVLALQSNPLLSDRLTHVLIFGLSGVICLSFAKRPVRFALGLAALMLASVSYTGPYGRTLKTERSFFGVYRVMLDREEKYHLLLHGSTIHGMQSRVPNSRLEPLSYFHATGPIGQFFTLHGQDDGKVPVAIIGLGTGSLACYAKTGQEFVFYEIDPLVESIARDRRYFSYLSDCPARSTVVLGDARISLKNAPNHHYGVLIVDAFSSDAIPIHLLTKEALDLYLSKVATGGVLAFHISNRHFDLAPVLGDLAREFNLTSFIQNDLEISEAEHRNGKESSRWVIMARDRKRLSSFGSNGRWQALQTTPAGKLWTDDFSNILDVLKLK